MENKPAFRGEPLEEKGKREKPNAKELMLFTQRAQRTGGFRKRNAAAARFADRFAASVTRYARGGDQPKWLRALVQNKASVGQLVMTLRDRVYRAPTKANQEFALLLANEIARMEGGSEALTKHLTPELLSRLSGKRRA